MAEISVIVPVYKVEPYLCRCLDSILAQTFTDFELILVDDGSPDSCGHICDEYAEKDNRIHVIHQKNGGLSAARNAGIDWAFAHSDSEWLSFVDSDDWVHPRYLELLYQAVNQFDVQLSQCVFVKTDGELPVISNGEKIQCITSKEQFIDWYSPFAWGKLYDKRIFISLRYPVGILCEDVTIWYRILFSLARVAIVNETLYYYLQRADSIMGNAWTPARLARLNAWDAQVSFFDQYGDKDLLETALGYYCTIAADEYYAISKSERLSDDEKRTYHANIDNRIRKLLRRYHKLIRRQPNYRWCLEAAHPILAACYWKMRSVLNALGRSE